MLYPNNISLIEVDLSTAKSGKIILMREGQKQDLMPQTGIVRNPQVGYEYMLNKRVWFHHFGYKKYTIMDGKNYFALPMDEIYCYEDENNKIVSPYHIIGTPIKEEWDTRLMLPFAKEYPDYLKAIYLPPHLNISQHPLHKKVEIGDDLICHKASTYKLTINKKDLIFVLPKYIVAVNEKCVNNYVFVEPFDVKNDYILNNKIYVKEKELHQKGFAVVSTPDQHGKFAIGDKIYYLKKVKYKHPIKKGIYYSKTHNIYLHDRTGN